MMEFGSEADLARAMQKQLGAAYLIMHSLPWVFPARDDIDLPAREGEADFLFLHRQYGLLIIEVKGGEITLKGRSWYRHVQAGLKEIKDPVRQARRTLWALKKRLTLICGKAVADQTIISVAVAFPHCLYKDNPAADLPAELHRHSGRSRRDRARDHPRLQGGRWRKARAVGQRVRRGAPRARARISGLRTTPRQRRRHRRNWPDSPDSSSRYCAASTVIRARSLKAWQGRARRRARSFAVGGTLCLFTCFNAELATVDFGEEMSGDLTENGGKITIRDFHRLASDLCKAAGVDFTVNQQDSARWWDEKAPDLLAEAALDLYGGTPPFDAMVVDEAQDFSPSWWDALEYLCDRRGSVWAFLDRAQSLRRDPLDPPLDGAFRFLLDVNCHIRRIVVCANTATQITSEPFELAPLGRPPKLIVPNSPNAISGLVQKKYARS